MGKCTVMSIFGMRLKMEYIEPKFMARLLGQMLDRLKMLEVKVHRKKAWVLPLNIVWRFCANYLDGIPEARCFNMGAPPPLGFLRTKSPFE